MLLCCKAYLTHLTRSVLTLTNPPRNAVILPCARNDKQQLLQTLFGMRPPKSQSSRAWNVNSEIHSALFRCSLSETRQLRITLIITQHSLLLLQLRTGLMCSNCSKYEYISLTLCLCFTFCSYARLMSIYTSTAALVAL